MAAPTTILQTFDRTAAVTLLDTAAKRLGTPGLPSVATVSPTGAPLDLGIVDISGGDANSTVENILWKVTADNSNTLVEDFGIWQLTPSQDGFTQALTVLRAQELMGEDGTPDATQLEYINSAIVSSYAAWADIPVTEGAETVLHPTDKGTTMALSTGSDDVVLWAHHLLAKSNEDTGTYVDLSAGLEFQANFGFSFS